MRRLASRQPPAGERPAAFDCLRLRQVYPEFPPFFAGGGRQRKILSRFEERQMHVKCSKCSQPIALTDIIQSSEDRLSHVDCRRPQTLTAEEPALLSVYCFNHAIARCLSCDVSFCFTELARPARKPYKSLPSVSSGSHRERPRAPLPMHDGSLRGTTRGAGGPGDGTAFSETEPRTSGWSRRMGPLVHPSRRRGKGQGNADVPESSGETPVGRVRGCSAGLRSGRRPAAIRSSAGFSAAPGRNATSMSGASSWSSWSWY